MGISSQRTPPKKRRERSIFGSIFNALMLVVLVEVLLLVASIYLMRVGPPLRGRRGRKRGSGGQAFGRRASGRSCR